MFGFGHDGSFQAIILTSLGDFVVVSLRNGVFSTMELLSLEKQDVWFSDENLWE
jgi:hypothetical protein